MTQEEKLLLQDLCARSPYGVKAQYYGSEEERLTVDTIEAIYTQPSVEIVIGQYGLAPIHNIKVKAESFIDACYDMIIKLHE